MTRTLRIVAVAVLAVLPLALGLGGAGAQGEYTVVALDRLVGSTGSCAQDINESGLMVGYDYVTEGHAVYWDTDLTITDIGTLPGGTNAYGQAINEAGDIVGYSEVAGGDEHAFFYDMAAGTMTDIHPPFSDPGADSEAAAVNDSGQVVGETDVGGNSRGFVYDPAGPTWTQLGTLGGLNSSAEGINDAGFVTGSSNTPAGPRHAFLWDPGTMTMSDLGTNGGEEALAFDINASNEIVGWSEQAGGPPEPTNGYLYDGSFSTLEPLSGLTEGEAIGMNDAGDAVGETWETAGPFVPTFWPRGQSPEELPILGGDQGFGEDVNDAGLAVGCTEEVTDGTDYAVLWLPPEVPPTTTGPADPTSPGAVVTPAAVPAAAVAATPRFTG